MSFDGLVTRHRNILLPLALFCFCVPTTNGQDCQGSEAVSVPMKSRSFVVQKIGSAVLFESGMEVDADGAPNAYGPGDIGLDYTANARNGQAWAGVATDTDGNPVTQKTGPYQGYYVSTTSLQSAGGNPSNPSTYVDATKISYIALPPEFVKQFGIVLGDLALIMNQANGRSAYAIYADVGPHGKIGEGSVALANALGFEHANPRHGGASGGIRFLVFPKSGLGQGKLRTQEDIDTLAAELFRSWGGTEKMAACSQQSKTLTGQDYARERQKYLAALNAASLAFQSCSKKVPICFDSCVAGGDTSTPGKWLARETQCQQQCGNCSAEDASYLKAQQALYDFEQRNNYGSPKGTNR